MGKIFGVFSVKYKNTNGKEIEQDLLVMENLFFDKNITQVVTAFTKGWLTCFRFLI